MEYISFFLSFERNIFNGTNNKCKYSITEIGFVFDFIFRFYTDEIKSNRVWFIACYFFVKPNRVWFIECYSVV